MEQNCSQEIFARKTSSLYNIMKRTISLRGMQALQDMRAEGQLCDAVLCSEDGAEFKVHSPVLSTCSPYFRALFTTDLKGGVEHRRSILIPGITGEMLAQIIEYAYTRVTTVSWDNVEELLPTADQFLVDGMKNDCTAFLEQQLTPENCIGIRRFAQIYWNSHLEKEAQRFLMIHFKEVAAKSEELLELELEQAAAIFQSEELNVRNEEVVWEAVIKWIDHNPKERRQYMVQLMRCLRLGLMDNTYFVEKIKKHPYVIGNDDCKPVMIETLKFLYDLERISQREDEVQTPELARPRLPYEIMFAIGGWSGGSATNFMESYDTRADRWIKVEESDPVGPRAYHKCAAIDYDIYVIGGFDGVEYFNSCRCFNVVRKDWREIAPMNCRRCYVSVAVLDRVIYAMGGYDGHHRQNTAERYDYITNQWSMIAPMNVQRSDACATALNGCIYITGGFNGNECLRTAEFYDPTTNKWTLIAPMHSNRSGVSCIAYHDCVFALGGFNGQSRLASGEKYDPSHDSWTLIPDMYNPRSNFAVEIIDDMIFAIGGFNGVTTIYHVECFDEKGSEWLEATDMNLFRSALAASVIFGMPNIRDFIHKHRDRLMEEKRQKLLQIQHLQQGQNSSSHVSIL